MRLGLLIAATTSLGGDEPFGSQLPNTASSAEPRLHALGDAVAEGPLVPEGCAERHLAVAAARLDHAGDHELTRRGLRHLVRVVTELRKVLLEPLDEGREVRHAVEDTVADLRRDARLDVRRHQLGRGVQALAARVNGGPVDVVESAQPVRVIARGHGSEYRRFQTFASRWHARARGSRAVLGGRPTSIWRLTPWNGTRRPGIIRSLREESP